LVVFGLYKPNADADSIVAAIQDEIGKVAAGQVSAEELERTKTKMLADFYSTLEMLLSRANYLAIRQLFTGDAASINQVPAQIEAVTAADLQRVAAKYLTPDNRASIDRRPAPPAAPAAAPAAAGTSEEASR
jgi:predicted Zn-dependent peptidase